MDLSSIINDSSGILTSKTFGGVSKESAMQAIKDAAEKVANAGKEAVGKVQAELESYKGKTAQEMAALTSQKDTVTLELKGAKEELNETKEELNKLKEELKETQKTKEHVRVLENGNKEIRKVNKNGAIMVKEVNANDQVVEYTVTQLDGSVRRTTFDPVTGKAVKTYTNVGGDKLIEYDEKGQVKSEKAVNKKTEKQEKPTLVSQTEPKRINNCTTEIERHYSDGSREAIQITRNGNEIIHTRVEKHNEKGLHVETKENWPKANNRENIFRFEYNLNGKTVTSKAVTEIFSHEKNGIKYVEKKVHKPGGINGSTFISSRSYSVGKSSVEAKAIIDEYGSFSGKYTAVVKDNTGKKTIHENITESEYFTLCRSID